MKILLVSDLHLEFEDITITNPGVDVLVLAGDIMTLEPWYKRVMDHTDSPSWIGKRADRLIRYRGFFDRVTNEFPHVVWVLGNHEFYGFRWFQGVELAREVAQTYNIHMLERDCVTIGDVTFVGGTLWTSMNKADPVTMYVCGSGMNDYRVIVNDHNGFSKITPRDTVTRHRTTVDYLVDAVEGCQKVVVVTHHAPTNLSVHPRYVGDALNYAYHSDLSEWILDRPQIKLWCHGHTHDPHDYLVGTTRVVCNPRGYHGYELTGWDMSKILEV